MKALSYYPKEKKTRGQQLEYLELIELHSVKCKVLGHYLKVRENRIDLNTHEFTDSLENSSLESIVKICKTCNAKFIEFFPFPHENVDDYVDIIE